MDESNIKFYHLLLQDLFYGTSVVLMVENEELLPDALEMIASDLDLLADRDADSLDIELAHYDLSTSEGFNKYVDHVAEHYDELFGSDEPKQKHIRALSGLVSYAKGKGERDPALSSFSKRGTGIFTITPDEWEEVSWSRDPHLKDVMQALGAYPNMTAYLR